MDDESSLPGVRIELCGELRLELDGRRRERDLPGRLGRLLLGYLVLHRTRAVTRDELIEALWPAGPPDEVRRTLSTLVSGLRRCVGADAVVGRGELQLVLGPSAVVDVERALAAVERGHETLAVGRPEFAAACAEAAVDTLERPLLADYDAPWLQARRRELEDAGHDALELLARAALQSGDAALPRALAASRRLVALAPFRESGYVLLMEAQAAAGNIAEALRTFDLLRRQMRDELGTAPSPDLRALHARLLWAAGDGVDEDEAPSLPLPAALARVARRPFVGRGDVLSSLRDHLTAAAGGDRRFVLLAGEPGIGKTSLAAAFAAEAHERGEATVLYGRSTEDLLVPYGPFTEMLGHWASHGGANAAGEELRFELEELGRLVPELRRGPAAAAGDERHPLFEAVTSALAYAATGRPLVLVVDDLHWSDAPTLQLLLHLIRGAVPERLLVLGTYRDAGVDRASPLGALVAELRREHRVEPILLAGLDEQETGGLVAHARLEELPAAAARRLRAMTGGNPLFLLELLRALEERSAEGVGAERAFAELGVPAGIRDVIMERVARLGEPARELLTLTAVAGQTFTISAPAMTAGVTREAAADVFDRAVEARLVVRTRRPGVLSFAHALVRDTLVAEVGDERRAVLHLRIAEALERHGDELRPAPSLLAHHFFEARGLAGPEPAIRYARAAAERAAESLAWEEAARALRRALEVDQLREPPDPHDRCELLMALGETLMRAGHGDARSPFADAARLARGRSAEQLARAAIGYAGRYLEAGVIDAELIAMLREALDALGPDEPDLRARLLARLAEVLHFANEPARAMALSEEAVALARSLGDDEVLKTALMGRQATLLDVAFTDERLAVNSEVVALARRAGSPEWEMQALHSRIYDLMTVGSFVAAREDVARLEALARERRQPLFEHFTLCWLCMFAQLDGRYDDAERLAVESFGMRDLLATRDAESVFAGQLFVIRRAQGRLHELLPFVTRAIEETPALTAWRAALPLVYLGAGEDDTARAELAAFMDGLDALPRDFFWLTHVSVLAEATFLLGATTAAPRLYDLLEPYATRFVCVGHAACLGPVARLLGLLAATTGDRAAAVAHFRDALERCDGGSAAFEATARRELAALDTELAR